MTLPIRREGTGLEWDPLREFENVYQRMGQLLRSSFGPLGAGARWLPVDIEETDDAYIVELEVPGVRREDLSIDVADNEIHVHGEVKERERSGVLRRQTRRTGPFDHTITLPGEINPDKIEATLADGVLSIRATKADTAKPRRIQVNVGT